MLDVIRIAHKACLELGIEAPRVGVCGLNPHAGEDGMFGREEIEEIAPAIEQAKAEGIQALGPLPPDTAFSKALGGWYDIVVAMYTIRGTFRSKPSALYMTGKTGVEGCRRSKHYTGAAHHTYLGGPRNGFRPGRQRHFE